MDAFSAIAPRTWHFSRLRPWSRPARARRWTRSATSAGSYQLPVGEDPGERHVVDAPRDEVGIDVDVRRPPRTSSCARSVGSSAAVTVMLLLVSLLLRRAKQTGASLGDRLRPPRPRGARPQRAAGREVERREAAAAGQRAVEHHDRRLRRAARRRGDDRERAAVGDRARRAQPCAASAGKAVERVDQQRDMAAAGSLAPAASTARSNACARASDDAENDSDATGSRPSAAQPPSSSGRAPLPDEGLRPRPRPRSATASTRRASVLPANAGLVDVSASRGRSA